jgi:restriction endonuclease Mrr
MSAAGRPDIKEAKRDALRSISMSFANARLHATQEAILKDVQKLRRAARVHEWNDDTAVSLEFFATHLDFTRELAFLRSGIPELVTSVTSELADFLIRNPQAMYGLTSRQFEEFVAEVFSRRGYEVELTLPTRDKGFDIVAIKRVATPVRFLIECKRYHPSNTVGIDVVQRLYGVTLDNNAQKGVIATTSYFTDDAKEVLRRHPKKLVPQDFNRLVDWLKGTDDLFLRGSP